MTLFLFGLLALVWGRPGLGPPPAAWAATSLFAPETQKEARVEPQTTGEKNEVLDQNQSAPAEATGIISEENLSPPAQQASSPPPSSRAGSSSGGSEILMDALGNKTLVVRGDTAPQVLVDDQGGRTQVLLGDDTAGLVVDDQGQKTLVVRGSFSPAASEETAGAKATRDRSGAGAAAPPAAGEKPYWLVEAPESEVPYFLASQAQESVPYWRVEETGDSVPYWRTESAPVDQQPYWLPRAEVVEILASEVEPVKLAAKSPDSSGLAAPDDSRTISYYMYQDEMGVKHLTNTPTDPRYRLFTVVVKMQRGLAGPKVRFTHNSLRPIIMKAATIYNLDPALIAAVIRSESAFDAQAVSWAGAQGLMQLMPGTARDMGVANPFDPEQNIMGGSRYLRRMLNRFNGDLVLAIAAYNCGPERVARHWRVPNIAETQNYVKIVTRNYDRYKLQF